MIDDRELSSLFEDECRERFQNLDDGLLLLEKNQEDQQVLQDLFREAHSLKGTARMLGLSGLEKTAHAFEDVLGSIKKGEITLTPELSDVMSVGLEDMRKLAREAVEDVPAGVSPDQAIEKMRQLAASARTANAAPPPRPATPANFSDAALTQERMSRPLTPPPALPAGGNRFKTEASPLPRFSVERPDAALPPAPFHPEDGRHVASIRVEPRKLDQLLNQAGELAVVRTRLNQRLAEAEEIKGVVDDWRRERRKTGPRQGSDFDQTFFDRLAPLFQTMYQFLVEDNQALETTARDIEDGVRNLRLLPLGVLFNLFPRVVRDLCRDLHKSADLSISGEDATVDKFIIEELKSPLTHLLRNAIHHGLESPEERLKLGKPVQGSIRLFGRRAVSHVLIEVTDDGRGVDIEAVRKAALKARRHTEEELNGFSRERLTQLIFSPGLSTSPMVTDVSGRGVGLDAVRQKVMELKGTVEVHSRPGLGCRFSIRLPISLTTSQVFIVSAGGRQFALPLDFTTAVSKIREKDIFPVEGRETIQFQGRPLSIIHLADLLGLPSSAPSASPGKSGPREFPAVIISNGMERLGLLVDDLLDQVEIVVKPHGAILKKVRNISGASILGAGEVCLVLDPLDLIASAAELGGTMGRKSIREALAVEQKTPARILLVEDSITTRTQEKRILESAGYTVVTAVDGQDALDKLSADENFAGVVSDVQMPNLDGLELTERIRAIPAFKELPVILVTSLAADEDRRRGLDAGADAYIAKPTFDQDLLLDTLRKLL
ncbi:MAG: hybrid sensor histidine kinase/response regulator [Pseudomonadota bacterium]